jgi:hypothetical protein
MAGSESASYAGSDDRVVFILPRPLIVKGAALEESHGGLSTIDSTLRAEQSRRTRSACASERARMHLAAWGSHGGCWCLQWVCHAGGIVPPCLAQDERRWPCHGVRCSF